MELKQPHGFVSLGGIDGVFKQTVSVCVSKGWLKSEPQGAKNHGCNDQNDVRVLHHESLRGLKLIVWASCVKPLSSRIQGPRMSIRSQLLAMDGESLGFQHDGKNDLILLSDDGHVDDITGLMLGHHTHPRTNVFNDASIPFDHDVSSHDATILGTGAL